MEYGQLASDKTVWFIRILLWFNVPVFLFSTIEIYTIILAADGMPEYSKRNIIGTIVLIFLNFFFAKKLRKIGQKKRAVQPIIFGILFSLIAWLEILSISLSLLYDY